MLLFIFEKVDLDVNGSYDAKLVRKFLDTGSFYDEKHQPQNGIRIEAMELRFKEMLFEHDPDKRLQFCSHLFYG